MEQGKLVVFEGIYGSGRLIVQLVNQLRDSLVTQGRVVYEIDSPDSGRAQLMGVGGLDGSWRYGRFEPDFFFELAGRARVASVSRDHLAKGEVVLCKSYTLSSIAYATLKGHDWFREDLNVLEARARGLSSAGEVGPDLTIFVDMTPETAARELGASLAPHFTQADLARQRQVYLEELGKLPPEKVKIVSGAQSAEAIFPDVLSATRAVTA
jgi:thymidylate kinase